jgi:hypothetical protein
MTSQKRQRRQEKRLNNKLREASELLMKDNKKGKTYRSSMAGPQVEGMALDGLEVIDLEEPPAKKKSDKPKPPTPICSWCHIVGHASNNHIKCSLTVKPMGKHYIPENVGAPRKCATHDVLYISLFWHA